MVERERKKVEEEVVVVVVVVDVVAVVEDVQTIIALRDWGLLDVRAQSSTLAETVGETEDAVVVSLFVLLTLLSKRPPVWP